MIHDGNALDKDKFPLEQSQRKATRIQRSCKNGELIAVNGPPGTGKTSMLRAVIASEWISAITSHDGLYILDVFMNLLYLICAIMIKQTMNVKVY
jgi:ABC-type lipoprotein export system ATPase subunit